ncbi:MAG: hypothetical protein H0X61_15480 [Acidimicrobiia bacterium]|nr:hypothetical protein [Acidimicrobiia bacterium]MDQ3392382.1 hypothetical protein [Actinomycetota bacterium]
MGARPRVTWRDRSTSDDFLMLQGVRDNDFFSIRNPPNSSVWRVGIYPYRGEHAHCDCSSLEEAKAICEESR